MTPAGDPLNGGVSVAETVLRGGRTRRPEMAPQVIEKARFAPGIGAPSRPIRLKAEAAGLIEGGDFRRPLSKFSRSYQALREPCPLA